MGQENHFRGHPNHPGQERGPVARRVQWEAEREEMAVRGKISTDVYLRLVADVEFR